MTTGPIHADRCHESDGGKIRFMTRSGGYVMARRPRCTPFVMDEKKWLNLPLFVEAHPSSYTGDGHDQ